MLAREQTLFHKWCTMRDSVLDRVNRWQDLVEQLDWEPFQTVVPQMAQDEKLQHQPDCDKKHQPQLVW